MYAKLLDGTVVENILESSNAQSIVAFRNNYGDAGAVRDLFTAENSITIQIFDDEDVLKETGADLVLKDGASLVSTQGGVLCTISLRVKTDLEKMHDEISELQDVVIEEV